MQRQAAAGKDPEVADESHAGTPDLNEPHFRQLFECMPQLGWTAQADGNIDFYNRGWYEYTGTTHAQMEGWGWRSVHDPKLLPAIEAEWRRCLAAGTAFEIEFPLRRHDGVFRWFLTRASPVHDAGGKIVRWVGINTDIEDVRAARLAIESVRKEAEAQMDAQRHAIHALFMDAPAAIMLMRGDELVIEFANPLSLELLGKTHDAIGRPLLEAVPELRSQGFDELLRQVIRTKLPFIGDEMPATLRRDGKDEKVFFKFVYTPAPNEQGAVDGAAVFAFDVTRQVAARERAMLGATVGRAFVSNDDLPAQLRRCCEALVDLGAAFARIWTFNAAHDVLELSASAGLYTHTDGPHGRVPLGSFKIGRIAKSRIPHLTNMVIGDPEVGDQEWAAREGMVAFAGYPLCVGDRLVGVMALFAKHELVPGMLEALATVADQIALGIDRDSSERFRELFIGMLGHDLRNPLNAVNMGTHVLKDVDALTPAQRRVVGRIRNSATRMDRMITQVLDFTRARSGGGIPIERAPSDIQTICAEAVDELAASHSERRIEAQYRGDGKGEWDADRLAQVFSNIVGNALTYGRSDSPVSVLVDATGDLVECVVHNMGPPIPAQLLPTLFDPFRRAHHGKAAGTRGLGLGLFIAQQIVMAHGGMITVRSCEAEGTQFSFKLPKGLNR